MKKLGCVNVHPGNFIRHLTDFSTWSELKYEKARMHNVHPGFSILHLTDISTSSELHDEKARMQHVHPSFFNLLQLIDFSAEG